MSTASTNVFDWEARIKTLPHSPGVYLMKSKRDEILYIGKAKDLKRRVRQYFQEGADPRPFVRRLPKLLKEIDVLLTHTEKEALLLEATLIQEHQPRFNILLKEEQRYLYLLLDQAHNYPRLQVVRRGPKDKPPKPKQRLFGPYQSGYAVRQALEVVGRCFRLRTCDDREMRNRTRPCLEHQIKRCDAPCVLPVPVEEYNAHIKDVVLFLEGKHQELIDDLSQKMWDAADRHAYELAAQYRDQTTAIKQLVESQQSVQSEDKVDRDIFGLYREGGEVEIQLLTVRRGRLSGGRSFSFTEQEFDNYEVLESFISAYYLREHIDIPREVLLPLEVEGKEDLEELLSERRGRKVTLWFPKRGDRLKLIELAQKNAEQGFLEKQRAEEDNQKRLKRLQKRLELKRVPYRIECIDNSHMQGRYPVSAIVVFEGGYPNRSAYRRYHLKNTKGGDDYGAMKEILTRRFKRGIKEQNFPDLLLVDGGRGQLKMAQLVLEELELDSVELAAIAKKRHQEEEDRKDDPSSTDRIYLVHRKDAIPVRPKHPELLILSRMRDEAHKTAITFHKKTRERKKMQSVLDQIPQIGDTRKKALLQHLGSVKRVEEANLQELMEVPGISEATARVIIEFFKSARSVQPNEGRKKARPYKKTSSK